MEPKVLQPADRMTTAQCVIECSGYLRTIANQEFEGEDWQTAPKLRLQNLLTDFLCNLELSGEEFAELCGLIGFQLSKTTTAKLAKFTVIAYDWQGEANGEATVDILAALDKCEGVTLIEERGYRPQARTYDYLRFHIAAFWRCLVNELRSLCLGVGLVVYPKEIPATPTETPRIVRVEIVRDFDKSYYANLYGENGSCHNLSKEYTDFRTLKTLCKKEYGVNLPNLSQIEFETHGRKSYAYISSETPRISTETAETVNVSTEGEKVAETKEMPQILNCERQTVEHLKAILNIAKLAKAGIIINGVSWHTEYLDQAHNVLARVDNLGWHDDGKGYGGFQGSGVFGKTAIFESWGDAVIAMIDALTDYLHTEGTEPPQSPEAPQTAEHTAEPPKPREAARKPQNRGIGSKRTTRRDTLRDTLHPVTYVPRECSTTAYW